MFGPLEMQNSHLAGETLEDRRRGEVLYFGTRTKAVPAHMLEDDGWRAKGISQITSDPERLPRCYGGDRAYRLTAGADGLTSNVLDMARFALSIRANQNPPTGRRGRTFPGTVLQDATLRAMLRGFGWGTGRYGFGIARRWNSAGRLVGAWHGGDTPGSHAMINSYNDGVQFPSLRGSVFSVVFNRYRGFRDPRDEADVVSQARFGDLLDAFLTTPYPLTSSPSGAAVLARRVRDRLSSNSIDLFAEY